MNGQILQDSIVELARVLGYRAAHFAPARTEKGWRTAARYDAKGFPDLVLVGSRVLFVEVKGRGDRLSLEQTGWIDALDVAGAEVHVWTPREWRDGSVERVLRGHEAAA